MDRFRPALVNRHAWREAKREKIPTEMIGLAYDDPDDVRPSDHDELREIRSRWFGAQGIEVVVDVDNARVITVWRRGERP
ncbi:MAG: hypothetical protein ABIP53_04170 [Candidatus Limnocylindrales bacterium]